MEEPERIGLTKETNLKLDELLEELNPSKGKEGTKLIKFDIYRLAVALGVKHREKPPLINGNTDRSFRVTELDQDKALYFAVQASGLNGSDESVYGYIERLAEEGIKQFFRLYSDNMGRLPLEKILI